MKLKFVLPRQVSLLYLLQNNECDLGRQKNANCCKCNPKSKRLLIIANATPQCTVAPEVEKHSLIWHQCSHSTKGLSVKLKSLSLRLPLPYFLQNKECDLLTQKSHRCISVQLLTGTHDGQKNHLQHRRTSDAVLSSHGAD